jgi:hypothetical protein
VSPDDIRASSGGVAFSLGAAIEPAAPLFPGKCPLCLKDLGHESMFHCLDGTYHTACWNLVAEEAALEAPELECKCQYRGDIADTLFCPVHGGK